MTIEPHYDLGREILYLRASGIPSLREFQATMVIITQADEYPPDAKTLWDIRELDFTQVDASFVRQLLSIQRTFPERGSAQLALVVSNDLGFGMARMFEMLTHNMPHHIRVFRDFDAAEVWLCDEHNDDHPTSHHPS